MITIETVSLADKAFRLRLDRHLPEGGFEQKVRDGQGYVIFADGTPVGILRWLTSVYCFVGVIVAVLKFAGVLK